MESEPMQVTHTPLTGRTPGAPDPAPAAASGRTAVPDMPLDHGTASGAGTRADADDPSGPGAPAGAEGAHETRTPAGAERAPGADMPAAAALYQLAAAHGGHGDVAALSAESGLDEHRAAAGWRTLAGLALVRISDGLVETLGSDAAIDAIVGRYASYAFEALRSVRAVNDTTRKLLTVFGSGAPGPGGIPAVLPSPGAAYTPYDDRDARRAGLLPAGDGERGDTGGGAASDAGGDGTGRTVGGADAHGTNAHGADALSPTASSALADAGSGEIDAVEVPYIGVGFAATSTHDPYTVRESAPTRGGKQTDPGRTGVEHHGDCRQSDGVPRNAEQRRDAYERGRQHPASAHGFGTTPTSVLDSTLTRGREQVLRTLTESTMVSVDCAHGGELPGDPALLDAYVELTVRLVPRGVRVRTLCTPTTLSTPDGTRYARIISAAGAQVRVVDRVSHDMLICDGHTVCLPDTGTGDPADPAVLRITNPQLARTFLAVYESYWQRAALFLPDGPRAPSPAPGTAAGTGEHGRTAYGIASGANQAHAYADDGALMSYSSLGDDVSDDGLDDEDDDYADDDGLDDGLMNDGPTTADTDGGAGELRSSDRELPRSVPRLGTFEQAVVRLMADGRDDADIARELGVCASTVDEVMTALMRRLGAANRFEAGLRLSRALDGGRLP